MSLNCRCKIGKEPGAPINQVTEGNGSGNVHVAQTNQEQAQDSHSDHCYSKSCTRLLQEKKVSLRVEAGFLSYFSLISSRNQPWRA